MQILTDDILALSGISSDAQYLCHGDVFLFDKNNLSLSSYLNQVEVTVLNIISNSNFMWTKQAIEDRIKLSIIGFFEIDWDRIYKKVSDDGRLVTFKIPCSNDFQSFYLENSDFMRFPVGKIIGNKVKRIEFSFLIDKNIKENLNENISLIKNFVEKANKIISNFNTSLASSIVKSALKQNRELDINNAILDSLGVRDEKDLNEWELMWRDK